MAKAVKTGRKAASVRVVARKVKSSSGKRAVVRRATSRVRTGSAILSKR